MTYYAFDLLNADGYDLRGSPLLARKDALQRVLNGAVGHFLYRQHLDDDGPTIHCARCAMGIEGVASKRADSHYHSATTRDIDQRCLVLGFVPAPPGSLKAIYLGRREGKSQVYAGKPGTGFSATLHGLCGRSLTR
jgi:bifunctional non-homologous end joining protein LigD